MGILPRDGTDGDSASRASPRNAPSSSCSSAHPTQARMQYVEKNVMEFRERHKGAKGDPPQPMGAKNSSPQALLAQAHSTLLPKRVHYPEVSHPPDPPPSTSAGSHCSFWTVAAAAAVVLLAMVAALQSPDLFQSRALYRGISDIQADRNGVDHRVLALDFLRTWASENNLHAQWSGELDDVLIHVEGSELRDPRVGTGVLLSCKVKENCMSLMNKLEDHLLEQAAASAKQCVVRLDHSVMDGEDLDGQVQHRIVETLKPCQKAVVIVDDADRMPYKAAKVFTNALSEMGGFIDWGKHVPSTSALYLMSMVTDSDANMSLEKFIKVVKDHFFKSLSKVDRLLNEGEVQTNMPAINAGALRRRLPWVIPVDPSR